ncbi:MAG TPA: SDR family NAD(P)-dependent oxidoreductase [Terracidiphilus sp.]|jgi:NAD(P)-dependent dehydrogenase (short-subunit alcohol dehydrogenase family)|nr:SDR family NAD(P)-dependent oxidoreductase [Terracidiphilus sp.]
MSKTVLITGASSGFGLLTSITLAKRGWRVLATMRDLGRRALLEEPARAAGVLDPIEIHALDVTNTAQIAALANEMGSRPDPLHAVINNAGFAVPGFADDVTDAELRQQFDTNFFGAAAVTRAFLSQLRRQGFGHIVMVSSISGRMGFAGVGSYAASKFALEGWTESLRYELMPLGLQVVLVEPGAFETDIWTRNAKIAENLLKPESPNAARVPKWRAKVQDGKKADPQAVVDVIAAVLENPRPKLRYVVGTDAKMGLFLRSVLPWSLFERLILKNAGLE